MAGTTLRNMTHFAGRVRRVGLTTTAVADFFFACILEVRVTVADLAFAGLADAIGVEDDFEPLAGARRSADFVVGFFVAARTALTGGEVLRRGFRVGASSVEEEPVSSSIPNS